MSINFKGLKLSAKSSIISAALSLIELIVFCIYGAVYNTYFDIAVVLFLAAAVLCSAGYALLDKKIAQWLNLVAVFCGTFALGLFFLNSYPVWADWYGGFTMYGSQGGIAPVIVIMVINILAMVLEIISCFTDKGGAADEA